PVQHELRHAVLDEGAVDAAVLENRDGVLTGPPVGAHVALQLARPAITLLVAPFLEDVLQEGVVPGILRLAALALVHDEALHALLGELAGNALQLALPVEVLRGLPVRWQVAGLAGT